MMMLLAQACSPGPILCTPADAHGHGVAGSVVGLVLVFAALAVALAISKQLSRRGVDTRRRHD
jgi:hypothetical protein